MNYAILFLIAAFLLMIVATVVIFTLKYVIFGLKFFIAKSRHKQNLAAIFIRSRNNSLGLPYLVNDADEKVTIKVGGKVRNYPLLRKEGDNMRWFDLPMYIFDAEDLQNELGFYYTDDKGNAVVRKSANFIGSESIQVIVDNELLTSEFTKLMSVYKTVYYIVLGLGIAVAFNAYVAFETLNYINNI